MEITPISEDTRFLRKTISDLKDEVDQLKMLQDISRQLLYNHDFKQIVTLFADIVKEIINYKICILYLFNKESNSIDPVLHRGISQEDLYRFTPDREIIDWVMKESKWSSVYLPGLPEYAENDFFSIIPVPGVKRNLGFLLISTDPENNIYNQSNTNHLSFIAVQAAMALENQKLYSRLSRSMDYVANILESINNGIIIIDMEDRITQLNKNATAMLSLLSADIIGFRYQEVLPPILVNKINEVRDQAFKDGFAFETLFEYSPAKDFTIPLGINASVLLDNAGRRLGTIIVFRNMFAVKELDRLRQLDVLKSEFVSNVSHELRSPLSIIKSYVEAILTQVDPDDEETRRNFLTVIDTEADRLTDLINDLLDISRIESGNFEINKARVNLRGIVNFAVRGIRDKNHLVAIQSDIPKDLPFLLGDADKLIQVFLNLLDNAVKFSPKGGHITVRAREENDMVRCDIEDRGIGIPEESIPKIFEKFYRVHNTDVYEIPGTGLGLPIVRHIILSHGGNITVQSAPEQGSTFTLFLPVET